MFSITSPFTPWEFSTWEAPWSAYQWVTQLAGWPEKLHVAAWCSQWQGEALAWDSWSGTRQRDRTEITGSTGAKKVGWRKANAHSAHCHRGTHAALSISTWLKLAGLSLRGKREYLWEGIYRFIIYVLHESLAVWKCWGLTFAPSLAPAPVQSSKGQLLLEMVWSFSVLLVSECEGGRVILYSFSSTSECCELVEKGVRRRAWVDFSEWKGMGISIKLCFICEQDL